MQIPLRNMAGETVDQVELRDDIFAIPPNVAVMHQALLRQLANARQGTASTKTRSDVRGGGRKPYRQKGTGRARHGSYNEPQMRGGGIVFGPHPRSYRKKMPRKMRRLALRSVLSTKAAENRIVVLDKLEMDVPRTKDMIAILDGLTVDSTALVLLPERNENVQKSLGNLPYAKVLRASCLNIRDILGYDYLVMPVASLEVVESILG